LITEKCASYCRFCFRRSFTGQGEGTITRTQIERVTSYIAGHGEIKELLITGGDPLMVGDPMITYLLESVRKVRKNLILRVSTRIPAVLPSRITPSLVSILKGYKPLWMTVQFNHPREFTRESRRALRLLNEAGIAIMNQAVLLKGVNDKVEILRDLCMGLVESGVTPGYILQADLAIGTSHFRVSLDRGVALYRALRKELSALAMPTYALDMPEGGGRISLTGDWQVSGRWYQLKDINGEPFPYPLEENREISEV